MSEMISLPVNAIPEPDRRSLENLLGHPLQANQQGQPAVLEILTKEEVNVPKYWRGY